MSTPIDREKILSLGLNTEAGRDQVREYRGGDGVLRRATTDELGNVTTEHTTGRVDVKINAPTVSVVTSVKSLARDEVK
jgi:hypothetical protein